LAFCRLPVPAESSCKPPVIIGLMRVFFPLFVCGAVLFAQTPAPVRPAAKSGVAHAPSAGAPAVPAGRNAKAPDILRVKFVTTKGDFVIEADRGFAPLGADRFYNLVKSGFFTNARFFRVVSGFMAQFGIPASPALNKAWQNSNIQDDPVLQSNRPGMVTFAKSSAPNSRSTQIFINLVDNGSKLDNQGFAPFGMVLEGMEVVQKLYSGYGDMPSMGGHGPDPTLIQSQGNAYLDKNFPNLDTIKSATIIFPVGAPAAASASKTGR
jgi:peptidyl-prolyl cis-trans isomerase A (cyclophilin A)